MNTLAAVVVQIIGLAVLRTEPKLGGMHVVLPSVAESTQVEPHSTILVFKNDQLVDEMNWGPVYALEPMPGYSYVKLNGERIRFMVNGTNEPAKIPAVLPHLGDSCPRMKNLSDEYQPPGYPAAAAVVMIPNGVSSACATSDRIDTRVLMANTGDFQVVGCNKSITLCDGAVVVIVNLPTAWVEGTENTETSELHSHVYFNMARVHEHGVCRLQRTQNVDPCNSPWTDVPVARRPANDQLMKADVPQTSRLDPSTTFDCSNTQWP